MKPLPGGELLQSGLPWFSAFIRSDFHGRCCLISLLMISLLCGVCVDVAVYNACGYKHNCVTQLPSSPPHGSWRSWNSVAFQAISRLKNIPNRGTEPWRANCSPLMVDVVSAVLGRSLWSSQVSNVVHLGSNIDQRIIKDGKTL